MKYLVLVVLLFFTLQARENPFEESANPKDIGKATLIKDTIQNFTPVTTELPSTARILKKVELHYQNLDGSIESKVVTVDKKIDWHDSLVLTKATDTQAQTITQQDSAEDAVQTQEKTNLQKPVELAFEDIISFTLADKMLHVKTTDTKIRDFLVTNPYKIVLDFRKELSFYTKTFKLDTMQYRDITIGKHDGYYRVAIELDGQYLYTLSKEPEGYKIVLR